MHYKKSIKKKILYVSIASDIFVFKRLRETCFKTSFWTKKLEKIDISLRPAPIERLIKFNTVIYYGTYMFS